MSVPLLAVENLRTGFDTAGGFCAVDGIDFGRAGRNAQVVASRPGKSVTAPR